MKLPNRVRRSWRSFLKFAGRKTTGEVRELLNGLQCTRVALSFSTDLRI